MYMNILDNPKIKKNLLFKKWLNLAKQAVKIQVKSIQGTYSEDIIEQNLLA